MNKLTLALSTAALAMTGVAFAAAAPEGPPPPGGMAMHHPMRDGRMGDRVVTRAEFEAMAKAHFDKLDVNHDGRIDKADHEAKLMEHFKAIDTDGNGSISPAEFLAAHQRHQGGHDGPGMGPDHPGPGGMDHGGMEHGGGGHEMMAMMMLRMADANKDHAVTRDEFMAAALKHFDMMDANHDGKLTPEERRDAMKKMHERMRGMMGGGMQGMPPMGDHMGDAPPPPPGH